MHEVYWDLLWSLNLSYLFFSMSPIYFIVDLFSWTSQVNFFPNPLRWYFNPRSKAWVHRQSATGTLAPSLILANDTIDLILPTFWIYPPKWMFYKIKTLILGWEMLWAKHCRGQPQLVQIVLASDNIATLGLHLGFSAKLRIWQVSACKMEPRSGTKITGPPSHPPSRQPNL